MAVVSPATGGRHELVELDGPEDWNGVEEEVLSPTGGRGPAGEVETELEDNGGAEDEDILEPEEVEERLHDPDDEIFARQAYADRVAAGGGSRPGSRQSSRPSSRPSSRGAEGRPGSRGPGSRPSSRGAGGSSDYAVPEANKEAWKKFGSNTGAGRALRKLYGNANPAEAASKVAYPRLPSPATRWEAKPAPRKACPQQQRVRVPRPCASHRPDPDDPRNWRAHRPERKPEAEIRLEIDAHQPQKPDLPEGRDQAAEKSDLADKFRYCGGNAMPAGAMGHVPKGAMPPSQPREAPGHVDSDTGMNREERRMFEELMSDVKYKQQRLKDIDATDQSEKSEGKKPNKVTTERNKEALQLQNDIARHMADIDKLLELTG